PEQSGPPEGFIEDGASWLFSAGGLTVSLDPQSGFVNGLAGAGEEIRFSRLLVDGGVNGETLFSQLGYKDMSGLATYELPLFYPRLRELPAYEVRSIRKTGENRFDVTMVLGNIFLTYHYTLMTEEHSLSLTAEIGTESEEELPVNGLGFVVQGLEGFDIREATYEFPGSTPAGRIAFSGRTRYKAGSADYSCPIIQIRDSQNAQNIIFVDEIEKWTAGAYYDENGCPSAGFMAAVEGMIRKDRPMEVGTFYLPLTENKDDPYESVPDFWAALGYHTPEDAAGINQPYAVYSAHPAGTMDTDYFNQWGLKAYAEKMDSVAAMGFDAVWLLPVFRHTGDNVYEPIDQKSVDSRYGGDEEAKTFIDHAHELGLSVLFDFAPHGPRPHYNFAKDHDDWVSKNREGENQIEWGCVSFDYNHPEYRQYNVDLAAYYAENFGLDGARIDCSMGGLPDWQSSTGLRASAAGLLAGENVVKALREGFLSVSDEVLLLPENFHPSPVYAEMTDVFYDMPLYRTIYDLNHSGSSETDFTERLRAFLDAEHKTSVKGQLKLRFLGNHDTVTWTFDAARAQSVYGTEKAKALWMVLGWIDGVCFIYQGDEDPETYKLSGENLESFFTEVIAAKKRFLPHELDIEYLVTGSPVFAFRRFDTGSGISRLVLVNLSADAQEFALEGEGTLLTKIGGVHVSGGTVTLAPYAGAVFGE
ncbi:MAG: hypothetical protein J6Y95_02925, partial [Lachnospiraceae bacterium]|nr:hypothetical protein [Lachnospiraceae bacterium]